MPHKTGTSESNDIHKGDTEDNYFRGRGAQVNVHNRFLERAYVQEHMEVIDEELLSREGKTQYYYESPKKIVNKVESPDVGPALSMNPYQGCEHGCIYCYARNTHEYWGFSAGLDFERKIIIKKNAAETLEKQLMSRNWKVEPIMLAGNTDCYQPVERHMKITRSMLEVLLKFKHPVGLITKNALILRDIDLLSELGKKRLAHVMVSITSLREELRQKMEPRTATAKQRLKVVEELNKAGVPCGVMTAPIVPGLNSDEIPALIKAAADHGAVTAGYTMVRLNGAIAQIFTDWVHKNFPDAAEKVLNQIKEVHGGNLNDSVYGRRMRGEGQIAMAIRALFKNSVKRYLEGRDTFEYDLTLFSRPGEAKQMELF
ncbi:MAG TPA: PA0069 family radical SAM protein [Bacteroidia bacterium]